MPEFNTPAGIVGPAQWDRQRYSSPAREGDCPPPSLITSIEGHSLEVANAENRERSPVIKLFVDRSPSTFPVSDAKRLRDELSAAIERVER